MLHKGKGSGLLQEGAGGGGPGYGLQILHEEVADALFHVNAVRFLAWQVALVGEED
jgi:hypothetical protein